MTNKRVNRSGAHPEANCEPHLSEPVIALLIPIPSPLPFIMLPIPDIRITHEIQFDVRNDDEKAGGVVCECSTGFLHQT